MTVIDFDERKRMIADRGEQFSAGQISESVFRASLMAMGLRRDDIGQMVAENAPAVRQQHEEARYEASVQWLREYLDSQKGRRR